MINYKWGVVKGYKYVTYRKGNGKKSNSRGS